MQGHSQQFLGRKKDSGNLKLNKSLNVDCVDTVAKSVCLFSPLPEFKLSKKAVKMSQCIPHTICVQVEVSQGLVSGDVPDLLQASCKVLSQGPHGYTLDLSVHDDGASSQTLHEKIYALNDLAQNVKLKNYIGDGTHGDQEAAQL